MDLNNLGKVSEKDRAYVDSFGSGDADTSTLTSDEFTVSSSYINLRTAGSRHPYNPQATNDNGGGKLLAGVKGHLGHIKQVLVLTTSTAPTWFLRRFCGNYVGSVFLGAAIKQVGMHRSSTMA